MMGKAFPCNLFPLGSRLAVIAIRVDGNAATRRELAPHLDILRVHQGNKILHDDVHAVLVEIAMVAEAEQIQLQALAFHHAFPRNIGNVDGGEIGLARDGAQAGELGAVELHEVIVARVLVDEGFQHARVIVGWILGMLVSQQRNAFFCFAFFVGHISILSLISFLVST